MRVTAEIAQEGETAPDGVLVRLAVRGDRWAEGVPPVPAGFEVSVSLSSAEATDLHGEALGLLGYRVVRHPGGEPPGGPVQAGADFLVPRALTTAHPRWWRALLERAERAYDLAFGPVAALLAPVVRAHRPP